MADEPVSGPPWQGRYAFDPQSIRPRDTDQPPGLSRGDRRVGEAVMHVQGEFQSREALAGSKNLGRTVTPTTDTNRFGRYDPLSDVRVLSAQVSDYIGQLCAIF